MDQEAELPAAADSSCSAYGEELAIRQAIHDLGSHDYEERAIARTYVLSAGQAAIPILMAELKKDKARSRSIAQLVALLVASILMIGPILDYYLEKPWIVPATNISACVTLLLACMLFTRPAWYQEASNLLAKHSGHEVTRAMIEALTDVWGEEQPRLRQAIIQRLEGITAKDAEWLKDETRERVIALLSMPNWTSPTCVDDLLTIARALSAIGATEALPVVRGANCSSLPGERRERLERGLAEVVAHLEELEAKSRRSHGLLRPAPDQSTALVRPVEQQPDAEPTQALRPVEDPDRTART